MADWKTHLQKIDEWRWLLPPSYKKGMRVPGLIYTSEAMLEGAGQDQAIEQVANVAFLPGIINYSMAMPDIHWGYGFPIGGVAAMSTDNGVISPGGVGFDINCGTRVLRTNITEADIKPRLKTLVDQVYRDVPSGLGGHGLLKVTHQELSQVLVRGAGWAVEQGYGWPEDLEATEGGGALAGANPDKISKEAKGRGLPQIGTLGSGNHFLEIQIIDEIYDTAAAAEMGIRQLGQVMVFIHTGSRGLGHQTCQDYLDVMERASARYDIELPDRQLACAPINSPEGQDYLQGMTAAANFAFCNRQLISHWVRQAFGGLLGNDPRALDMHVVYDVAHNIAKIEKHRVDGRELTVCVHRKGATRAFAPGHPELPARYRALGQPVMVPGDMGRYSYIALGTQRAMEETWGSTCHGAGRAQSRGAAKRMLQGVNIAQRMAEQGIYVRAQNRAALAEEASEAYKDVASVVDVLDNAGISREVCRMRPIGVVKG